MTLQTQTAVFAAPLTEGEKLHRHISGLLRDAGISAYLPDFPFHHHHAYYRTRLKSGSRHLRRSDVGNLLREWATPRENLDDYTWQAVCGALLYDFEKNPENRGKIPDEVLKELNRLKFGYEFESWARKKMQNN